MNAASKIAMLQLEHVRSIAWSGEYTGADGRVDPLHSSARDEIMAHFFRLYKPTNAVGGIKHLVEHQAHCGDYIIADTEFFKPLAATDIDAENLSDLEDSSDDSPDQKYDGSWGRTHDAAIIMVDCNGNLKYKLFSEKMDGARTPLSVETRQRAIGVLKGMDAAHLPGILQFQAANILPMIRVAKFVFWGPPEIQLAELAGRRATDRSDGVDVRTELVKVIPNCRPSGTPPFSLSQDLLVPFLGIRLQPHHEALQDTLDEAITITTLLRGLVNFYASPPRASVTSSWTCATADADLRVRVTSGNKKRTLTMREAIVDEQDGGTFLAEMTDGEFGLYQRLLCGGKTPQLQHQPIKLNQLKLFPGTSRGGAPVD
jgi:hypothetical protein